jgi:hypothetical protein
MSKNSIIAYGHKWYFRLDELLEKNLESRELIICYTFLQEAKVVHVFSKFNFMDFYKFLTTIPEENKHFFELIRDERPHKAFFDIDIKDKDLIENYNFLEDFLEQLTSILSIDIERDVLVYTSHGEKKHSYHILLNYKTNMAKNKLLANLVNEKLQHKNCLDLGVYNKNRQLRILGCTKLNEKRFKVWLESFQFKGRTIKTLLEDEADIGMEKVIFLSSLVNYVQKEMKTLDIPEEDQVKPPESLKLDLSDLSEKEVSEAKELVSKHISPDLEIREVQGKLISFNNTKGYYCKICLRIHDQENPFVAIISDKVYFYCRRSENNKKLLLGTLMKSNRKFFKAKEIFLLPNDELNQLLEVAKK